jgi:rod shape determining protein RodA
MKRLLSNISIRSSQFRSLDWLLLISVFVLLLLGLSAIYSVELSQAGGFLNVKKQLIAVGIASVICFFVSFSNYQLLRNYSLVFYAFGVLLLGSVLLFGESIRGAQGWFVFGAVSFQPVELMKVALIIALAAYFSKHATRPLSLRYLGGSMVIVLIPFLLVMLQPDLGSASVLLGIWLFMALFAGMRWLHTFILAVFGSMLSLLAWFFFFAEYQKARILTFLNPTYDPLGQGYNVTQAIIAIGSGGLFGSGLGFGTQSHLKFLPESQTDFIFAVIAEELGFIGVLIVMASFALLFSRIMRLVFRAANDFSAFLLLGVGSMLFLQLLVNIGMNLGLFPVTGIGLPFVSYGGSSLLSSLVLIAIVQSIACRDRGVRQSG